jgi:hypothetical protein
MSGLPDTGATTQVAAEIRSLIAAAEATAAEMEREARDRAAAIVVEAEREGEHLIQQAREQAGALLADRRRRLDELSGEVASRAESALAELDRAAAARKTVDEALQALAASAEDVTKEDSTSGGRPEAGRRSPPRERLETDGRDLHRGELSGAQLVASEMLKAGSDRAEVASHLRRTFGLRDPDGVLDPVFANGDPSVGRQGL